MKKDFSILFLTFLILVLASTAQAQFIDIASDFGMNIANDDADEGSGASFVDFNGDGWDDVSMATTNGKPRFWINDQNGGFVETDLGILPDNQADLNMLLWVDYDNDGDRDLFISAQDVGIYLFENDGNLNLTDITEDAGLVVEATYNSGACWGDINNDGLLDLYLSRYHYFFQEGNQYENRLFVQNDDGTFSDITSSAGVANGSRNTYLVAFWDYDEDGWIDIFIANDLMNDPNFLFRNNGDETFTDVSAETGFDVIMNAMSATVGDYDNDEDMDLFVSNTGEGNHLYRNNNDGTFTNVGTEIGVAANSTCWGAVWIDYDNNGWQDLYTGSAPLNDLLTAEQFFFESDQGESFNNITEEMELDYDNSNSYAACQADYDRDGREDILVSPGGSLARLFKNNTPTNPENNWVSIELKGTYSNADAVGARFKVYCDDQIFYRSIHCGEGYISQHSSRKHVGLGMHEVIDSLEITWPRGYTEMHYDLGVNQLLNFEEGETIAPNFPLEDTVNVCQNSTITLNITGNYEMIEWSNGEQGAALIVSEAGEYSAMVTHESGISFQTDTVQVLTYPLNELEFNLTQPICNGDENGSISLSSSIVPLGELEWFNFGIEDSLTGLDAGTYFYQGIDSNGCAFFGDVELEEPEELTLSNTVVESLECSPFWSGTAQASGGIPPYQFQWTLEGPNTTETIENSTFDCFEGGNVELLVTDSLGCSTSDLIELNIVQSVDLHDQWTVSVYPNPGMGMVRVSSSKSLSRVLVYRPTGELIFISTDSSLDFSWLPAGVYIIQVHDQFQRSTNLKFMKF